MGSSEGSHEPEKAWGFICGSLNGFEDVNALVISDPEHSEDEERFVILGFSLQANLLVVCHCYRASESVIRIISARKATKNESKQYNEG